MKGRVERIRDGRFTGHDKRVTLTLARLSTICSQYSELSRILQVLPELDYDLSKLNQEDLEILYSEFDEKLEARVKSEFEADPSYCEDLRTATGICPLCGHDHCRFIFRINNLQGGEGTKCGSSCIITYGISVKGAETAALAKKFLIKAVNQAIKRVKIEAWHKEYGFDGYYMTVVYAAMSRLCDWGRNRLTNTNDDFAIADSARRIQHDIFAKLDSFYSKHGWLATERRWNAWLEVVRFVRRYDDDAARILPLFKAWEPKKKLEVVNA